MSNIMSLNGKSVSASQYYYGCDFTAWDTMTYPTALIDRRDRAFALYIKLQTSQDGIKAEDIKFEDKVRLFKVQKAYEDCAQLCDERNLIK